jgi:ABC-2 type transport system ATP-binding protein
LDIVNLQAALPLGSTVAEDRPGSYVVTSEITPDLLAAITAWCAARDVLADGLTVERRSLEDVFLSLTASGGLS